MMQTREISYGPPENNFRGFLATETGRLGPKPVVLIAHTIRGRTDFEEQKALALARQGYTGFAIDLYGNGKQARNPDEAQALMQSLNTNRKLLLSRMLLALETARSLPGADPSCVAGIGFCFGGKCILDLARSGADLAGVASFHGLYDPPGIHPDTPITAPVLVLHGWDDPLAPPESVVALGQELTRKGARWELVAYGHTGHAFTNPMARDASKGLYYSPEADAKAWARMLGFFKAAFREH